MAEEAVNVILKCGIECKKSTEGLKELHRRVEELHKKAREIVKIPLKVEDIKPLKPPEMLPIKPEVEKPKIPKPELPKISPIRPEIPKPKLPLIKPIRPEIEKLEALRPKIGIPKPPEIPKIEAPKIERPKIPEFRLPPIKPIELGKTREETDKTRKTLGEFADETGKVPKKAAEGWSMGTKEMEGAMAGLPKVVQGTIKTAEGFGRVMGIKIPKVTEKGGFQQIRMFRWIGRDMIRLGRMTEQFGKVVSNVWAAMITNSVALESVFFDIKLSFEDVTAELGEALAPNLEWTAISARSLANAIMGLPESVKATMGGFVMLGTIIVKLVPIWMMLYGYIMLSRFSLLQATVAAGLNEKGMNKLGKQVKKTGKTMKWFSKHAKKLIGVGIGLTIAFSALTTEAGLAETAVQMGMAGLITGAALYGALGAAVGAVAGAIVGLVKAQFFSSKAGEEINETTLEAIRSFGYMDGEVYDMAEAVKAAFTGVKNQYGDTALAQDAFRWDMEALGFTMGQSARLWEVMGGKLKTGTAYYDEVADKISFLSTVMGVESKVIVAALAKWGIDKPGEILLVFEDMASVIPSDMSTLESAIILSSGPIQGALSLTNEEAFNLRSGLHELEIQGITSLDNLAVEAGLITTPWETAMNYLAGATIPLEAALLIITGYTLEDLLASVEEAKGPFDSAMVELAFSTLPFEEALELVTGMTFEELVANAIDSETPFGKAMGRMGEDTDTLMEKIEDLTQKLKDFKTEAETSYEPYFPPGYEAWREKKIGPVYIPPELWGVGEAFHGFGEDVYDALTGTIETVWGGVEDVASFLGIKGKVIPWFQKGGPIETTGPYMLHAGEYVLPRGMPVSVSNVFNISATITTEADKTELAEEISRLITESYRRG